MARHRVPLRVVQGPSKNNRLPGRASARGLAAHKHKNVRDWLTQHPRFKVHFTPTHASWMNLVEVWFGLVERRAVRRGVFKSVPDLNAKLRTYIEGWNEPAHPFVWTKTAEEILKKANRPTTSNPRH